MALMALKTRSRLNCEFMPRSARDASPLLLLLCMLIAGPAAGQDYGITNIPVADTTLFETAPDNNLGASTLAAGTTRGGLRARALIQFDLRSIPTNAVIQLAALSLTVVRTPQPGVASVFNLRRISQPWGEGSQNGNNGGSARTNETTWNMRFAPSTPWSSPGGSAPADFSATVSATASIGETGTYTFSSTPALVADVQAWTMNPAANFGWILMDEHEELLLTARRFGSREDPVRAPFLAVQFTLPQPLVSPFVLSLPQISSNQVQFSFPTPSNRTCAVEYSSTLSPLAWQVLVSLAASNGVTNVIITDPLQPGQRFYRVRTP